MTKEQFFGRCLKHQCIDKTSNDDVFVIESISTDGYISSISSGHDLINCQIIGRRISRMTNEDKQEYIDLCLKQETAYRTDIFDTFESVEFCFDNGYFPDSLFERGWVVEA